MVNTGEAEVKEAEEAKKVFHVHPLIPQKCTTFRPQFIFSSLDLKRSETSSTYKKFLYCLYEMNDETILGDRVVVKHTMKFLCLSESE